MLKPSHTYTQTHTPQLRVSFSRIQDAYCQKQAKKFFACAAKEYTEGAWVTGAGTCFEDLAALVPANALGPSALCSGLSYWTEDESGDTPGFGIVGALTSTGKFWAYYVIPEESTKLIKISWCVRLHPFFVIRFLIFLSFLFPHPPSDTNHDNTSATCSKTLQQKMAQLSWPVDVTGGSKGYSFALAVQAEYTTPKDLVLYE